VIFPSGAYLEIIFILEIFAGGVALQIIFDLIMNKSLLIGTLMLVLLTGVAANPPYNAANNLAAL
jgi:hypothetical protein